MLLIIYYLVEVIVYFEPFIIKNVWHLLHLTYPTSWKIYGAVHNKQISLTSAKQNDVFSILLPERNNLDDIYHLTLPP